MAANTNPKQCDHCLAELPQTYRLEMPGYEAQGKERIMNGQVRCSKCGKYSLRVQVFGGGK